VAVDKAGSDYAAIKAEREGLVAVLMGKARLWPHVLDSRTTTEDRRVAYQPQRSLAKLLVTTDQHPDVTEQ